MTSQSNTVPTRFVEADGTRFAYRRFGDPIGTPIVLLQHFMGNLDNYDPAITDGLAMGREVILTDNAGVGLSTGKAPQTIAGMGRDAASLIDGLERIRARTAERDVPVSEATVAAHLAAAHEWGAAAPDSFDYLKAIPHPALVVNGSNDVVVPTINSYILQQNLPNAELILFPDSNHGSHFQFAELFNRYVSDFLDR
jgi:pimeloyl-ACP methyl ester carboxylesterase